MAMECVYKLAKLMWGKRKVSIRKKKIWEDLDHDRYEKQTERNSVEIVECEGRMQDI